MTKTLNQTCAEMAKKPAFKADEIAVEDLPEVQSYIEELEMLEEFRNTHKQLFETYSFLVEKVNQRLSDADKAVRGRKVSCGPWVLQRIQKKYDAQQLRDLLGEQEFLDLGGSKRIVVEYDITKDKVEAAIARKDIEADVAEAITTETPVFSAPKALQG